jgi:hypothetical protein
MVSAPQPGMLARWVAREPMLKDFWWGFQSYLSSGHRSRTVRVLAISWSYSGNRASLIRILSSIPEIYAFYSPYVRGRRSQKLSKKGRMISESPSPSLHLPRSTSR